MAVWPWVFGPVNEVDCVRDTAKRSERGSRVKRVGITAPPSPPKMKRRPLVVGFLFLL